MIAKTAEQIKIRNFRWEDLAAATEARRQTTLVENDEHIVNEDQFRHELEVPGYDALHDAFLAVTPEGEVVGFCDGEVDTENQRAFGYGFVVPQQRRQGIGKRLLEAADTRLVERMTAEVDNLTDAFIQRYANAANEGANALLRASGYEVTRYFYRMLIDLKDAPDPTPLPPGVVLRNVDAERDVFAVFEADQEAFADHWGFAPLAFEEWKHYLVNDGDFDPTLAWPGERWPGCGCR